MFVKNLAYRADEGALAEFFAQCGELVDLRLGRMDDGRSRGFCHVAYKSIESAERQGPLGLRVGSPFSALTLRAP